MTNLPDIAIIGPGKVGVSIACLAQKKGYRISAIAGRDFDKAQKAAQTIDSNVIAYKSIEEAASKAKLVLLTVSGDAIERTCQRLAQAKAFNRGSYVVHVSGLHSSTILSSARELCDCYIASAHPLQTFAEPIFNESNQITNNIAALEENTKQAFWFCEGDKEALAVIKKLVSALGSKSIVIAPENKVLYHCAATVACNYLTTLMDVTLTIAANAKIEKEVAWKALLPLIQTTITNIGKLGTKDALTGPIARGDVESVKLHLNALADGDKNIYDLYKTLGRQTIQLAIAKQSIDGETANLLLKILS